MRIPASVTFMATVCIALSIAAKSHASMIGPKPVGGHQTTSGVTLAKHTVGQPDMLTLQGYAAVEKGDFAAAAETFKKANETGKNLPAMLGHYLALERIGEDGLSELKQNAASLTLDDARTFAYAVIDFYLGRRTLSEMTSAAKTVDEVCAAQYYAAEWHLLRNRHDDAVSALSAYVDACPVTLREYAGAAADLKRLNADGYQAAIGSAESKLASKLLDR